MTLQEFETEDAIYYLGLGNHFTSSAPLFKDVDFSELDLIVFENDGCYSRPIDMGKTWQFGEIYTNVLEENPEISMYTLDICTSSLYSILSSTGLTASGLYLTYKGAEKFIKEKQSLSRREFLKNVGKITGGTFLVLPLLGIPNTFLEELSFVEDLNSIHTNIIPLDVSFRDAVVAKKISEYLVPKHKQDNKKVKVGIVYGAGHSGMETKIKYLGIADMTISLYQDVFDYIDTEHLNEVRELVRIDFGGYSRQVTRYHDSKLF